MVGKERCIPYVSLRYQCWNACILSLYHFFNSKDPKKTTRIPSIHYMWTLIGWKCIVYKFKVLYLLKFFTKYSTPGNSSLRAKCQICLKTKIGDFFKFWIKITFAYLHNTCKWTLIRFEGIYWKHWWKITIFFIYVPQFFAFDETLS